MLLLLHGCSFSQKKEIHGKFIHCDTDQPSAHYYVGEYSLQTDQKKKKSTFTYIHKKYYDVSADKDTNVKYKSTDQVINYTLTLKDTALLVQMKDIKDFEIKKYRYIGREYDSLVNGTILKFIYDPEDFPDDEMYIYMHPDYGVVKMRNRVWFWISYYYNNYSSLVVPCDCSKMKHDWNK